MTLRNSPVETLQSKDFERAGLKKEISDEQLKTITSDAVRYFNKQDFSALCSYAKSNTSDDYYLDILNARPVTKEALFRVANSSAKSVSFKPTAFAFEHNIDLSSASQNDGAKAYAVLDGYSEEIDPKLAQTLSGIVEAHFPFFISDSFKYLTRNFKKLTDVIEFLLTRNTAFVTANVYLENGYAEKRIKPLRASHGSDGWLEKLFQNEPLGHKHKSALKLYAKILNS